MARSSLKAKVARIQGVLDELFPEPAIPLDHTDPFTLLVSVVLSAQTTDKKVNQVTPGLFAFAGTPETMGSASEESIRAAIREVGLAPQKARALRGLADQIVRLHGGQVPRSFEALMALPGVGRKTANVVLAQAFGEPAFPVDTHIHRLAHRWGLSTAKGPDGVEADLVALFPRSAWNKVHLQMIYFGRTHCPALRHDPGACPICSFAAPRVRAAREGSRDLPVRAGAAKRSVADSAAAQRRALGSGTPKRRGNIEAPGPVALTGPTARRRP